MASLRPPVLIGPDIQAIITDLIVPALLERLLAERFTEPVERSKQPTCVESQPTA